MSDHQSIDSGDFDFDEFQQETIARLKAGEPLLGKEGLLTPLVKQLLEAALEGEVETHLEVTPEEKNRRNGKSRKTVQFSAGSFELETPRDRNGSFQPELVKKRQTRLGNSIENKIIALYALGMSYRDITDHMQEMYGLELSPAFLSSVTDKILPLITEWQSRPLEKVYPFVWMDAIHFKVREEGKVRSKAAYTILGLDQRGMKDVLGIYLGESEGARFWLQVLTDLSNRGVQDILIASIDNLKGFSEAVESIFPDTEVQLCIVHQVRNSLKYVASKDQKAFMKDLKKVYRATTKEQAEKKLHDLESQWGRKYPIVLKSWHHNWDRLSQYFKYPEHIRRIIYTTNTIEGFHRQIRKVTKTKGAFSNETALIKLLYLAVQRIREKWTMPAPNWALTISQMSIFFEGRLKLDLAYQDVPEKNRSEVDTVQ